MGLCEQRIENSFGLAFERVEDLALLIADDLRLPDRRILARRLHRCLSLFAELPLNCFPLTPQICDAPLDFVLLESQELHSQALLGQYLRCIQIKQAVLDLVDALQILNLDLCLARFDGNLLLQRLRV